MLSTFLSMLPGSIALLWTSFGPPQLESTSGMNILNRIIDESSKIVKYQSISPSSEIEVNMDGSCQTGENILIECDEALVGKLVSQTLPILSIVYRIYYSLLIYTVLLGILFHFNILKVKKSSSPSTSVSSNKTSLKLMDFRRLIIIFMLIKDFLGYFFIVPISLALLILPILETRLSSSTSGYTNNTLTENTIIDVTIGLGSIISFFVIFGSSLWLTFGFITWSNHCVFEYKQIENGLKLDDESMSYIESINIEERAITTDTSDDEKVGYRDSVIATNQQSAAGTNHVRKGIDNFNERIIRELVFLI
ncbi:uncharacterized protein L201_005813 [Kwoniella dendrophila CBS 6074]|uniref:Uncharacterized protein n=1 Tax=Kwoniella dendrophila CBS 6074 TaxID=1295534 RepID=A0AAX4K017_9TREE